jgi:hypothetical protein
VATEVATVAVTAVVTEVVTEEVTEEADLNMASENRKVAANLNVVTERKGFNKLNILTKPESIMPSGFFD